MNTGKAFPRGNWWQIGWNEGGKWRQKSTHYRVEGNTPPPEVLRMLANKQEEILCLKTGKEYIPAITIWKALEELDKLPKITGKTPPQNQKGSK